MLIITLNLVNSDSFFNEIVINFHAFSYSYLEYCFACYAAIILHKQTKFLLSPIGSCLIMNHVNESHYSYELLQHK